MLTHKHEGPEVGTKTGRPSIASRPTPAADRPELWPIVHLQATAGNTAVVTWLESTRGSNSRLPVKPPGRAQGEDSDRVRTVRNQRGRSEGHVRASGPQQTHVHSATSLDTDLESYGGSDDRADDDGMTCE